MRPRRVTSWLGWWVLCMAFWVWIDDDLAMADLGIGAAVAALGAWLVELVQYQTASRIRLRSDWVARALTLPWQVLRETGVVLGALAGLLFWGRRPRSGFEELPVEYGEDSAEGLTRRSLIVAANSLAPNTFALGIDRERSALVVHRLVLPPHGKPLPGTAPGA